MDLLEYQAKELFRQVGIPILPSQTVQNTTALKRLQIPYPMVLKSQVRAGGRGKAGGVRFVENTIDAIAAASAIFHLPIADEYPEVILAEARYDAQSELFLAIVLDYQRQCPVLMGSSKGGIDVETLLEHMQSVSLRTNFSPYLARRLAVKMGLTGPLVATVSSIIEKMYELFIAYDLDVIEINPLGINADGGVMALDGKITVNDTAIARHPDLLNWRSEKWTRAGQSWLPGDLARGQVGLICNSEGLALSTWDLLGSLGVTGAYLLDESRTDMALATQLEQAFDYLSQAPHLKGIFVNLATREAATSALAEDLRAFLPLPPHPPSEDRSLRSTGPSLPHRQRVPQRQVYTGEVLPIVIRFSRGNLDNLKQIYHNSLVHWHNDLETAIAKMLSLIPQDNGLSREQNNT
ncbi:MULTISPECIES: ATP-grasp domain-containing protein [unclassified Synechocystis]|uniref:ATP-grasp domain-containing protein n=1 Tax=unclassified Synechocystis TaxID=2640012 RepID=UPI000400D64E|nr:MULTISPECIES: ATP-grasp domain-containing protein [unclassified Synechocystis]AIE73243.1 Succinyl-CoA ligase [ADP-forming] beta chain [Synechocystis sp. PCC 6714]MCT0253072.1 acetate--CoA ligase family protein [Synechocystis sp. CS-94]